LSHEKNAWIRLLNLPTNDAWIHPWIQDLEKKGVTFVKGTELVELKTNNRDLITSAVLKRFNSTNTMQITSDYYFGCIPVEKMKKVVTPEIKRIAPSLANLDKLVYKNMNGIQFYLKEDIPVIRGHVHATFSEWYYFVIKKKVFSYSFTKTS
jgi:15-cis-phytoene desaturase